MKDTGLKRRVSSVDVYDELHRELLLKEISPGSFIDVREKAEAYGTSIVPIREALLCLSETGLLVRERNKGFMVRQIHADEVRFAHDALRHLAEYYLSESGPTIVPLERNSFSESIDAVDPYMFFKQIIQAASRIFIPHVERQFRMNMNVISTTWCVLEGQLSLDGSGLRHLWNFVQLANAGNLSGALFQLNLYNSKMAHLNRKGHNIPQARQSNGLPVPQHKKLCSRTAPD
ncbi:GntR family transcriptional regulator [Brucella intermedia]|uniref:GntR family transcriptional regulator n=1 Tax=Brucella TaxID=234 RepID=UPI0009465C68|nr:GntR family transcriptional regulator [Brucella intermedia]